jgi:hypothetical protein
MYAVVRETTYQVDRALADRPEFTAFQDAHATQPGYLGTLVTHLGNGRHVTVTLWDTSEHMNAARNTIGPAVKTLIEPLMTQPTELLGTGEVAYTDIGAGGTGFPLRPASVVSEASFTAQNRAFVLEMLDGKKRLEDYPDRVDPDLTVHEPVALPFGGTYTGIAEFTRFYDKVRSFYDFTTWRLLDVVAAGDIVFSTSRVRVAGRKTIMHIAERFRFRGTTLIEVRVFICDEEDERR